jgi:KDO2-lipid IV(A) lauroyltransferase
LRLFSFLPYTLTIHTAYGLGWLARLCGAEVCLMTTILNSDRKGYTCNISAPLSHFPTDNVEADTARLNKCIEDLV